MAETAFRILIADDEYWVRQAIETLIDWPMHGFVCLPSAKDGEDALEKIKQFRPHIVLLDIDMPFLSGIELTKRIRQEHPEIAVLILSGYSDFSYVREALMNGAVDYLLKPATRDKLLAALSLATGHLLKKQEERQMLDALREKSTLASSMLQDRELCDLLKAAIGGKAEQSARSLMYDLQFSHYYLVQIRLTGLRQDVSEAHRFKDTISAAVHARQQVVFHDIARPDTFYLIAEIDKDLLTLDLRALLDRLKSLTGVPITILMSRRKLSFRQLKAAYDELRQLQLIRAFTVESCILSEQDYRDMPSRVTAEHRHELELSVKTRSRALFERVLYDAIGLKRCTDGTWCYVEVIHTLNMIGFILRNGRAEAEAGNQALALESLMELMLVAVDRYDIDEMFSILEEMLSECFSMPDGGAASDGMRQTIRHIKKWIAQNYFEELSLSILARRFMVDDAHLSRIFKQVTGENLMLYIARTRIEKAQEYIVGGQLSLGEIASMTGYDDYTYFNRVFRKITGVSPSAYKEGLLP